MVEMRTDIQRRGPTAGMRTWIKTRERQEWDRKQV
jgi:hypothetical protein